MLKLIPTVTLSPVRAVRTANVDTFDVMRTSLNGMCAFAPGVREAQ